MPELPLPSPLSHAYIITGGSSAARRDYALRLAQAYVCRGERPPCRSCRDCEKAAAGIHPDVIAISPAQDRRDILSEQTRALRADAYIRPNEADRKVYLIDPADSMNQTAQNTLLKVLEEGPAYAAFLLLAQSAGGLLQTIRSRCELLTLPPEAREDPDAEVVRGAAELLRRLAAKNEAGLAEFCVTLEKWDREAFSALLEETVSLLHAALVLRTGGQGSSDGAAAAAAQALTAAQLSRAAEVCRRLSGACDFNVGVGHLAGWLCGELSSLSSFV